MSGRPPDTPCSPRVLLLLNLGAVVGFAFPARAILAARGVSLVRLLVASVIGFVLGLVGGRH